MAGNCGGIAQTEGCLAQKGPPWRIARGLQVLAGTDCPEGSTDRRRAVLLAKDTVRSLPGHLHTMYLVSACAASTMSVCKVSQSTSLSQASPEPVAQIVESLQLPYLSKDPYTSQPIAVLG